MCRVLGTEGRAGLCGLTGLGVRDGAGYGGCEVSWLQVGSGLWVTVVCIVLIKPGEGVE